MLIRATVRIGAVSNIDANASINVLHLYGNQAVMNSTTAATWGGHIETFYQAVEQWYSPSHGGIVGNTWIDFAQVATASLGAADDVVTSPLFRHYFGFIPTFSGQEMPGEVAACLSHNGFIDTIPEETGNTRPRSRRRGRIYLGPVAASAMGAQHDPNINADFRGAATLGFKTMCLALAAETGDAQVSMGIYSPTSDSFASSIGCHMDNSFDTVRSRGIVATARTVQTWDPAFDHIGAVDGAGND